MIRYSLPEPINGLAGVAFKIWRQRFSAIWPRLRERGLLNDWRHEGYRIAFEAHTEGLRYGDRDLPGFVYRAWYGFLVRYGFIRPSRWFVQKEIPVGEFGEGFLEKAREVYTTTAEVRYEGVRKRGQRLVWENGDGYRYVFTSHFLRRWRERVPLEFSPRAVQQQLRFGSTLFSVLGQGWTKSRIKCPWFTVVMLETDNKRVFITVW